MVQHSGAPLLSVGAGRRAPPSPGSEIRVWQLHRGSNNNPMLWHLLGRWDREGEVGEVEEMKTGPGRGLILCHGPGAELVMGLSVCMESGGNGGGGSPEGGRAMRLYQTV